MNKIVNKFKRRVLKDFEKAEKEYNDECDNFYDAHQAQVNESVLEQILQKGEKLNNVIDACYDKNKEIIDRLNELDFLVQVLVYDNGRVIKRYDIVKKYLKIYGYNEMEQAEVLAYFLNVNLKYILSYNIMNSVNYKKVAEVLTFVDASESLENFEENADKKVEELKAELEIEIKKCEVLRNIISEDGEILANKGAKIYRTFLQVVSADFDFEVIDLIINASINKYQLKIAEEKNLSQERTAKEQRKEEYQKSLEVQKTEREKSIKEQKDAIQKLKAYFVDDMPIIYISPENLVYVLELMAKAGYTAERIRIIKRHIMENNARLAQAELEKEFLMSKQKYLSVEEIDVLAEVEEKLCNHDSCINPLFISIKENYEFVKDELLKLAKATEEDPDSVGLIKLAIAEMQETMVNYLYSDYRVTLELTKKEEQ